MVHVSISIDSNAPTTRGSRFALAFLGHNSIFEPEITLYITTEQNVSNFSIKTKFSGLTGFNETSPHSGGFNETSPDSGLYSRTGTAQRGKFTVIQLQAAADVDGGLGQPDLSVLSDGYDESDRQKGLILTADNSTDELTVYAFRGDIFSSTGTAAFMAINCVEFPTARDYQYFVFSSEFDQSSFLITPCHDNTTIRVRPSQPYTHPSWVNPSMQRTTPGTIQDEAISGRSNLWTTFQSL